MVIKKIPAGTCIYLTKKNKYKLSIQPDKTLVNDNLYVAYDVRIDGETVIPRGTRVVGDWVTESYPNISAQLQLTRIFLYGDGQEISADSDVIEATTEFNNNEINGTAYLQQMAKYRASSGIVRRIVHLQCKVKTLLDNCYNVNYLEISTKEIPVYLTCDFVACPCFS